MFFDNSETIRSLCRQCWSNDHDMAAPYTGTQAWTPTWGHQIVDTWRPWLYLYGDQLAGYMIYPSSILFNSMFDTVHRLKQTGLNRRGSVNQHSKLINLSLKCFRLILLTFFWWVDSPTIWLSLPLRFSSNLKQTLPSLFWSIIVQFFADMLDDRLNVSANKY